MQSKLKVKIIKLNKNLFHIVISLTKKSLHTYYLEKIGVCFFSKKKKIIIVSLKKLIWWLNKGVQISNYISYIISILFFYYIQQRHKNKSISMKVMDEIVSRKIKHKQIINKIEKYFLLKNYKKKI